MTPQSQPVTDVVRGFITEVGADAIVCIAAPKDKVLPDLPFLTEIAKTLETVGEPASRSPYHEKVYDAIKSDDPITLVSLDREIAAFYRNVYGLPAHLLVINDDNRMTIYDYVTQCLLTARACGFAHLALPIFPPGLDGRQPHGLMTLEQVLNMMVAAIRTFMVNEPGAVEHITVVAPSFPSPELASLLGDFQTRLKG